MVSKEEQVIDGISSRPPLWAGMMGDEAGAAKAVPKAAATTPEAKVDASARTIAGAAPPVDVAKVAALREAIASGAYKPDPVAIAERIIAFDAGSKSS